MSATCLESVRAPGRVERAHEPTPAPVLDEWLLTNGLGGFAMGTVSGVPTRRYHGLIVSALTPPVGRQVVLNALVETLTPEGARARPVDLSSFRFRDNVLHPRGDRHLVSFAKDVSCRWVYRVGGSELVKELFFHRESDAVSVRYTLARGEGRSRLTLRPLMSGRDFHSVMTAPPGAGGGGGGDRYRLREERGGLAVSFDGITLRLHADPGTLVRETQWWYGFEYEQELARGYPAHEDLFSPCAFECDLAPGQSVTFRAWLGAGEPAGFEDAVAARRAEVSALASATLRVAGVAGGEGDAAADPASRLSTLVAAADDFVVRRGEGRSVIAGYPWFSDWGRDTMIALPGLFLSTGRHREARDVLATFAQHRRRGLIPNLFSDHGGAAHFNTVDAPLWFIHASALYLDASKDREGFDGLLLPACLEIVEAYTHGTDFGIGVDPEDGLVAAGGPDTQLTWMDAQRDGVTFTPRHGKPVEINALWYNALLQLAKSLPASMAPKAEALRGEAGRVGQSFRSVFWDEGRRCCYDTVERRGEGWWDPTYQTRPNQIFAVSLPHSPLSPEQQKGVLEIVRTRLLTAHGLRTLEPGDPAYRGRYQGRMFDLDAAYHNGTAWPWLLGAYAEAVLRAGAFSPRACQEAREALEPLLRRLDGECAGQLAEIFDGDDSPDRPQRPCGCPAQAWSVAELLRLTVMILRAESSGKPKPRAGKA